MKHPTPRGYLMLTTIVYGAIFVSVLGALTGYVLIQNRMQSRDTASARATAIAEAGVEYYRWFLAHYPNDLRNGTGQPGPYSISYTDPEGGETGTISLSVEGNTSCGEITSIDIESTGTPTEDATVSQTVTARYARPTVARYSYVLNSSVYAGPDRLIYGPYHSNGGINMQGTANSSVTSSLESWFCNSTYGCSPSGTKPGVFGSGDSSLWSYPAPQIDFGAISADFSSLKTKALASGRYLPRYSTTNNKHASSYWRGYHLIFNANGTVTVRRVSATTELPSMAVNPADDEQDSNNRILPDRSLISNDQFYSTLTIPTDCALIFVEDNTWIEGTIDGKVTVVVANVANTGIDPSAVITDNLVYETTDGSDGLTLIAERNILIAPDSPYNMTLNGIFIAQGGSFGRNYYQRSEGSEQCNTTYEPKGTLTILGTTVSNLRTGTKWANVDCGWDDEAGYDQRTDAYHRKLSNDPPPFTPETSSDFEFIEWRER